MVIRWIESRMNDYLNEILKSELKQRVIYSDTDSIYITLDDLVQKVLPNEQDDYKVVDFLDNVVKAKLEPFIIAEYEKLFKYMNHYENHMVMEREVISNVAIWTGKKRYFMNVQDNEGVRYNPPKFKVMGIEVVKSSTPLVCRDKLGEALKIILNGTEDSFIEFIGDFKKEFMKLKPEEIAFPRGTNDLDKWLNTNGSFKSGCPIHVRGVLVHNKEITEKNLLNDYNIINAGDKILFLYMKLPNTIKQNVFSFVGEMPHELNLERYVDYELQFTKTFLDPLVNIAEIIGWKTEESNDIRDLLF